MLVTLWGQRVEDTTADHKARVFIEQRKSYGKNNETKPNH